MSPTNYYFILFYFLWSFDRISTINKVIFDVLAGRTKVSLRMGKKLSTEEMLYTHSDGIVWDLEKAHVSPLFRREVCLPLPPKTSAPIFSQSSGRFSWSRRTPHYVFSISLALRTFLPYLVESVIRRSSLPGCLYLIFSMYPCWGPLMVYLPFTSHFPDQVCRL